jgi:hypothetical protein
MTKKQEDKLILDDFNAQVVQKMLEFAYDKNVKLKNDMKFVEQLLVAAEKYEIGELKVGIIWRIKMEIFRLVAKLFFSEISTIRPRVVISESPKKTNAWSYVKSVPITCVPSIRNSVKKRNLRTC